MTNVEPLNAYPIPTAPPHDWKNVDGGEHTPEYGGKMPGTFLSSDDLPSTAGAGKNDRQSVIGIARKHLPESVKTPSRNDGSQLRSEAPSGSRTGVGSLPGAPSENNVTKLPEEQTVESSGCPENVESNNVELPSKEVPGGSRTLPGTRSEDGFAELTDERAPKGSASSHSAPSSTRPLRKEAESEQHRATYTLPSKEVPSGSRGGVGSLPGNLSEASVAKLPEERLQEGLPSHETDHEVLGKSGGIGALPGPPDESRVALLPEERAHSEGEIYKHVTKTAPPESLTSSAADSQSAKQGVDSEPSQQGSVHAHANQQENVGGVSCERQKVGFVQKVKGEAKVISGKLSHDEKKVEQGKHIMGKQ